MQKQIIINSIKIKYNLKKYRNQRRINLIFHQDGSLVVTSPYAVLEKSIEDILYKNINWIQDKLNQKKDFPILTDLDKIKKAKKFAKLVIEDKLKLFNQYYKFTYNRISIRDQKTRWGSCSSSGCLSFNYKIIYLSEELREYIVVHELCHLREMNHSINFWNLVAERIPDYKERRKNLKKLKI